MRARNLKPGFFKNEQLGACGPWTRLLFEGLWCLADREGRLEERQSRIKIEIFPYDAVEIEPMLQELALNLLIIRYTISGASYIAIPTFCNHQTPHIREAKSVIPAPPSFTKRKKSREQAGASTNLGDDEHPLNPFPESPMPESPMPESGAATPPGKTRPIDPLYAEFQRAFREKYDWDYDSKKGDFVQLATLKKSHNGSLAERWPAAVKNYLATPQKSHTLADLVANFASFQRSPGNQYGRPVIDATIERKPGYSEGQSAKIRAALGPLGVREVDNADAIGVERRLQAPGSGRRGTGFDSG